MSSTLSFFNKFKKFTFDSAPFTSEPKTATDPNGTPSSDQEKPDQNAPNVQDQAGKTHEAKFRFKPTPLFGKKRKVKEPAKQVLAEPKLEISNTKVNGNVFNIVNGSVQFGNSYSFTGNAKSETKYEDMPEKSEIKLNQDVSMLMGAQEEPEHIFLDTVAKNLGKHWRTVFRSLGLSQGKIETKEEECGRNGISEVRYQLLLEWVRSSDDVSLGKLTSQLWEQGEKELCIELAKIYKEEKTS